MLNSFEFQGTKSKSQYAALLDMSIANPDVNGNDLKDGQGPVPAAQTTARLQLYGRATLNSPDPLEYKNGPEDDRCIKDGSEGTIKGLMTEGPVFSITPPSNFTVRLLLEGYHKGVDTGIVGILGNEQDGYENNALRVRFYRDNGGEPGLYVPNTETVNKSTYSTSARSTNNRNRGNNTFANIPFTLTEATEGLYYVVVDNINYLPIMTAFPAQFLFEGDDETT
jgi:hypothetical protein